MVTVASLELPTELLYIMLIALFVFSCVGLFFGPRYLRASMTLMILGIGWTVLTSAYAPGLATRATMGNILIVLSMIATLVGILSHQPNLLHPELESKD